MKHPRTTIAGFLTILGSVISFGAAWLAGGVPSADQWALLGGALTVGAGLISAADGKKPE